MRLHSRGLGRLTLPFSLGSANIERREGKLWLYGKIQERTVNWTYRMLLEDEDIVRFIALARKPEIVEWIAKKAGWSLLKKIFLFFCRLLLSFLGIVKPPKTPIRWEETFHETRTVPASKHTKGEEKTFAGEKEQTPLKEESHAVLV
jgi:hypothetical protein